jgi:imidazolonepropionase-like amidohydrolase
VKAARARGAAGGTVVTGTDLSLGADYHRELELLQGAGLAPWDVLRCATVNGAAFPGRTHDLGSLMPGYAADLVLLDADPGQDARNLTAIWRVDKGGQLIDRDALDLPLNRPLDRPLSQSGAPGQ